MPKLFLPKELSEGFSLDELASIARESYRMSSNETEAEAQKQLLDSGLAVIRRGWPDFLTIGLDGDVRAVEVKNDLDSVSPTQKLISRVLTRSGIPTVVWRKRGDDAWTIQCPCCGGPVDPELRQARKESRRDPYEKPWL